MARGQAWVTIRLPVTRGLATLMQWTAPRMDMLKNMTQGGLVQPEWQTPLEIMSEFFTAACRQLGLIDSTDMSRATNVRAIDPRTA
jgi:hypothetical protein